VNGRLAWVSDLMPSSTHNAKALRVSGLLGNPTPTQHSGDKGYQGLELITPVKKPSWDKLPTSIQQFNRQSLCERQRFSRTPRMHSSGAILDGPKGGAGFLEIGYQPKPSGPNRLTLRDG